MTEPYVDICIPVHNAWDYLERCILSIYKNTIVPYRLVIHDDASDEPLTISYMDELAREFQGRITIARSERQCWFTTSVNRCLQLTKAQWILVVNSDVQIQDPEWFEKFMLIHEGTERAGLIGCPDSRFDDRVGYEVDGKVQGHIWFFKRENLQHVGLLDEQNPDCIHIRSDDEWSARWRSKGFKTMLATSIRHLHGGDSHPGGGASWGRQIAGMPSKNEHVAVARSLPMRILVDR